MKIYTVSTVAYDHLDNNIWHEVKAFASEEEARKHFEKEKKSCYADAQGKELFDSEEDYYVVDIEDYDTYVEYYRNSDEPIHYLITLREHEV